MFRICLLGVSLDNANRGVGALTAAASRLLLESTRPCELTLLVPGKQSVSTGTIAGPDGPSTVEILHYSRGPRWGIRNSTVAALICALLVRATPIPKLRMAMIERMPLLSRIYESDFVADLFAGDSFSDIYGVGRLVFQCVPRWCVVLLRRPYVLLPQTYGPFVSRTAKAVATSILRRAAMVFARTQDDSAVRALLSNTCPIVRYCPDVAFSLHADDSFGMLTRHDAHDATEPATVTIGLNVSGLLYNGGYNRNNMFNLRMDYRRFVHDLVRALLAVEGLRVVLIPHTYSTANLDDVENDLGACLSVASAYSAHKGRCMVIDQELDQHQIKGAIGGCDLFVGSRLHSCIAALSQGIATIGVGYSKKFVETFSTLGVGELVVDARTLDTQQAVERVTHLIETREKYRDGIVQGAERNRRLIDETFASIGRAFRLEGFSSSVNTRPSE